MTLQLMLGGAVFASTLLGVMARPRRISEAAVALAGGAAMIALGAVPLGMIGPTLLREWNVYGFFIGLMVIAALAEQAGVFTALANGAARWAGGSAARLYLAVFGLGTLITAVLSNDATALILTPVVWSLATRLRLPVLPFMFACTFIADTASTLLPVSNPINILVMSHFPGGLAQFWRYLLAPSLACVALNIGLFWWIFRRDLGGRYDLGDLDMSGPANPALYRATLAGLGLIALAYVLGSLVEAPLALVALAGAAGLLIVAARHVALRWGAVGREISPALFGFITGMFLVVRGIEQLGLTARFGAALLPGGEPTWEALARTTFGTALGSNLINNVPMALVMTSALEQVPDAHPALVHATMFGADLGPNLTIVGSLATMLWLVILRRKGLEISAWQYFKLGLAFVVPALLLGTTWMWLAAM